MQFSGSMMVPDFPSRTVSCRPPRQLRSTSVHKHLQHGRQNFEMYMIYIQNLTIQTRTWPRLRWHEQSGMRNISCVHGICSKLCVSGCHNRSLQLHRTDRCEHMLNFLSLIPHLHHRDNQTTANTRVTCLTHMLSHRSTTLQI